MVVSEMKKVGIVSCYFKNNYGSMLQAYATKKILDNNNIPNETINIDNNIDFNSLSDTDFDSPLGLGSGAGLIFGSTGGVCEATLRWVNKQNFHNLSPSI